MTAEPIATTDAPAEQLAALAERLDQLERLTTSQRAEIERLRAAPVPLQLLPSSAEEVPASGPAPASVAHTDGSARSRRALLKLCGVTAAAGVAAAAAAATGNGTAQARRAASAIFTSSTVPACEGDGTLGAIGVKGTSDTHGGVVGNSDSGVGVAGVSNTSRGVEGLSSSDAGVVGVGGTYGGTFAGGLAPIYLPPAMGGGPPSSGSHQVGEVYVDGVGVLWTCTGAGTAGTWVRLTGVQSGTLGGALNYLAAPIRIFDSRVGTSAPLPAMKGALAGGSTTTIQVTGTDVNMLHVPAGAVGVFGNLTVTNTQGGGDLILWPHGAPQPTTSNINYVGGQTVANSANIGLSAGGALDLFVHVSGTDVIFDVAGYVL
jgi:hypothetical protein